MSYVLYIYHVGIPLTFLAHCVSYETVICTSAMCESPEDEILKGVEWNNHSGFAGRRSCIEWQAIPVTA